MAAGYKSPLWLERLSAKIIRKAGYKSFLAFWLGGASARPAVVPPTPEPTITIEPRRWPGPSIVVYRETDIIPAWQRNREDEEILFL